MRVEAVEAAKDHGAACPIAGRDITNPVVSAKWDWFFARCATSPDIFVGHESTLQQGQIGGPINYSL